VKRQAACERLITYSVSEALYTWWNSRYGVHISPLVVSSESFLKYLGGILDEFLWADVVCVCVCVVDVASEKSVDRTF